MKESKWENGAPGPDNAWNLGIMWKESWEIGLVGLNPGMANGGLASKPQTETYGQTTDIFWFVNLFTRKFWQGIGYRPCLIDHLRNCFY